MAHLSIVAGERCGPPHRRRSPARSDRPAARLGAPERRRSRLLRTRWSPHHRGTLRTLGAPALALCLFLLAGSVASAAPTPSSLHERLTRLNARADQTVEQYLQAKLVLQQTQRSGASLQRRAADARKERDRLSAVIAAQAADTYVNGAGAGLASVLGAGDPNVAFDRMQTLSVLAQQNSDRLADLRAAEQVYQQGLAALTKVQRQQAAELHRLATRKAQVQQLVDQTERLLAQLRASAASRQAATASSGVDPGLPASSAPAPSGGVAAVVRYAEAQVGKPYVWGADGPGSFDCSGLTMMAWRQAGISLPHSAAAQYTVGRHESARAAQPSQGDHDEPADRRLGRQAGGRGESVETVARELVRCDIIADVAGLCGLGQQLSDHAVELLLGSGDLPVAMQERPQFGVAVAVRLMRDERVSVQHRLESLARVAGVVSGFGELLEVAADLAFVPGEQDRLDVWEVLVQRCPSDAGLLGDRRHRHRGQPVVGHQCRGGVQDRVAHRSAMRLDRLVPQPGHHPSLRDDDPSTL